MSGRCGGLHCPGCGDGGGSGLAVLVALVLILAAAAGPAIRAVTDVLEIALAVTGGLLVTGGTVAVIVWRHRRRPAVLRYARETARVPSGAALPEPPRFLQGRAIGPDRTGVRALPAPGRQQPLAGPRAPRPRCSGQPRRRARGRRDGGA